MSAVDDAAGTGPSVDGRTTEADATRAAADRRLGSLLAAGGDLLGALRRLVTGLLALVSAEARILRASAAMVVLGSVALVAFAVSLWFCVVAVIGWALSMATGSIGIALGLLVVLHLILVGATWFVIGRAIRRASFPESRAEFKALGRTLRADVAQFQHASGTGPSNREPSP